MLRRLVRHWSPLDGGAVCSTGSGREGTCGSGGGDGGGGLGGGWAVSGRGGGGTRWRVGGGGDSRDPMAVEPFGLRDRTSLWKRSWERNKNRKPITERNAQLEHSLHFYWYECRFGG